MPPSNTQIVTAFESLGLQPEEIAGEFGYELLAVKSILMQCSSLYRKACGKEPEDESALNFSNDELKMANDVIVTTAQYAEDQNLKLKAAIYIRNDKKGRLEVVKEMPSIKVSVVQFNMDLKKALESKERAKSKVIDIPADVQRVLQEA